MSKSTLIAALALISLGVASNDANAAVGRTSGSFGVSNSGSANYSIPIWTPPGIKGMQAQLALVYDSNGGNGYEGVGWGIAGLASISRCAKTWAQDGERREVRDDLNDTFCLNGGKLRLVGGTYGTDGAEYRTEIESFARIRSYGTLGEGPAYFIVESKDGLIYEYGNTSNSQVESVGQPTARLWTLSKVRDRSGNAILYTYDEDTVNGGQRINNIQYTQNTTAGVSPHYQVTFVYEALPTGEVASGFLAGSQIKRISRLDRIDVTHDGVLVHRYDLGYEAALSSTTKSRLQSVTECAGSTPDCLLPTTFTYQNGTVGVGAETSTGLTFAAGSHAWHMDVNGDGREDLVYPSSGTPGAGTWRVALGSASGGYGAEIDTGISNAHWSDAVLIDYNADGLDDLLVPYSGGTWWVILGTPSGLAAPFDTGIPASATGVGVRARAMDVDGDGLQGRFCSVSAASIRRDLFFHGLHISGTNG
jgi:hypothetical protein